MTSTALGTLCSRYLFPLSIILIKYSSKSAQTWFTMGDNRCICQRLTSVIGDGEKLNDVVFCGAVSEVPEGNVVFFPGDVQVKYLVNWTGFVKTFLPPVFDVYMTCSEYHSTSFPLQTYQRTQILYFKIVFYISLMPSSRRK